LEELNWNIALANIDGWGEEDQRAATLTNELHNMLLRLIAVSGGKVRGKEFTTTRDWLPRKTPRRHSQGTRSDVEYMPFGKQARRFLDSLAGFHDR